MTPANLTATLRTFHGNGHLIVHRADGRWVAYAEHKVVAGPFSTRREAFGAAWAIQVRKFHPPRLA